MGGDGILRIHPELGDDPITREGFEEALAEIEEETAAYLAQEGALAHQDPQQMAQTLVDYIADLAGERAGEVRENVNLSEMLVLVESRIRGMAGQLNLDSAVDPLDMMRDIIAVARGEVPLSFEREVARESAVIEEDEF